MSQKSMHCHIEVMSCHCVIVSLHHHHHHHHCAQNDWPSISTCKMHRYTCTQTHTHTDRQTDRQTDTYPALAMMALVSSGSSVPSLPFSSSCEETDFHVITGRSLQHTQALSPRPPACSIHHVQDTDRCCVWPMLTPELLPVSTSSSDPSSTSSSLYTASYLVVVCVCVCACVCACAMAEAEAPQMSVCNLCVRTFHWQELYSHQYSCSSRSHVTCFLAFTTLHSVVTGQNEDSIPHNWYTTDISPLSLTPDAPSATPPAHAPEGRPPPSACYRWRSPSL